VEKNFTNTMDREKNKLINFGRSKTKDVTRSYSLSTKATLFQPGNENSRDTGTGYHAGKSRGTQETRKTAIALD
jgi:hypothetical protein